MSKPNNGGPAFPKPRTEFERADGATETDYGSDGMSLRAFFAGRAMQGIVSNDALVQTCIEFAIEIKSTPEDVIARRAVNLADKLIAELSKDAP